MQWDVTTPPTGSVLTWDQLRHHLHAPTSQKSLVEDYLASATAYAETMLDAVILPQTITAIYDHRDIGHFLLPFHYDYLDIRESRQGMELPRGPILSITSVKDINGADVAYERHTAGNAEWVFPTSAITSSQAPIAVVYQAGFQSVPADIVNAIRVHTATMYMVREGGTNLAYNDVHKLDTFYQRRGRGVLFK